MEICFVDIPKLSDYFLLIYLTLCQFFAAILNTSLLYWPVLILIAFIQSDEFVQTRDHVTSIAYKQTLKLPAPKLRTQLDSRWLKRKNARS